MILGDASNTAFNSSPRSTPEPKACVNCNVALEISCCCAPEIANCLFSNSANAIVSSLLLNALPAFKLNFATELVIFK